MSTVNQIESRAMLREPGRIVAHADGSLWVADTGNGRVIGIRLEPGYHSQRAQVVCTVSCAAERSKPVPRGLAISADGERLYVADSAGKQILCAAVSGMPHSATMQPIASTASAELSPESIPDDLALDEDSGRLYFSHIQRNHDAVGQIAFMDLQSEQCVLLDGATQAQDSSTRRPTHLLTHLSALTLSPDRRRLYVACGGALQAIDLEQNQMTILVPADAGFRELAALDITPGGLIAADAGHQSLRGINLRHGRTTDIWTGRDAFADAEPGGVAFERHSRSYIMSDRKGHRLLRIAADASSTVELDLSL